MKIEKGTGILLPNYSLHHHVDYYPDSNVFRPERFAENSGGIKHFKDLGVFLPFGNGPRLCLGIIDCEQFKIEKKKTHSFDLVLPYLQE